MSIIDEIRIIHDYHPNGKNGGKTMEVLEGEPKPEPLTWEHQDYDTDGKPVLAGPDPAGAKTRTMLKVPNGINAVSVEGKTYRRPKDMQVGEDWMLDPATAGFVIDTPVAITKEEALALAEKLLAASFRAREIELPDRIEPGRSLFADIPFIQTDEPLVYSRESRYDLGDPRCKFNDCDDDRDGRHGPECRCQPEIL